MRIVIVGGGAKGRLFGSYLIQGGNEIVLIDRDPQVIEALKEKGIGLLVDEDQLPEDAKIYPVQALCSAQSIKNADFVLLLVKSKNTLTAVKDVSHLITPECPLLSVQTGLSHLEIAERLVHKNNILLGISSMTGTALSDAVVRKGGDARLQIGELNSTFSDRLQKISSVFNDCGLETHMSKSIVGRLWSKVIIYSALNPVSALLQVPNGLLTSKMEAITLLKRLLDEGKEVAGACSVELAQPDLYEQLFETCERSGSNLSPMLQDILNEVETEIDAQNGELCRYADKFGIRVPTHKTMVELIKLLESWKPRVAS